MSSVCNNNNVWCMSSLVFLPVALCWWVKNNDNTFLLL